MVVKAIQIDTVTDTIESKNGSKGHAEIADFKKYYKKYIKDQLKVDNGMWLR